MKFVKGDAIAGIIMLPSNIVGGLAIGVAQQGMSARRRGPEVHAAHHRRRLVAQIPALMISTAAGIIVTRVGAEEEGAHLGQDIGGSDPGQPKALGDRGGAAGRARPHARAADGAVPGDGGGARPRGVAALRARMDANSAGGGRHDESADRRSRQSRSSSALRCPRRWAPDASRTSCCRRCARGSTRSAGSRCPRSRCGPARGSGRRATRSVSRRSRWRPRR